MHDFTKEELTYLWESIDTNCDLYSEPDLAYLVRDKLKAMIDNYPEACEDDGNTDNEMVQR